MLPVVDSRTRSAAMLPGVFVALWRTDTISPAMKATTLLAFGWQILTRLAASGLCTTARLVLKILYPVFSGQTKNPAFNGVLWSLFYPVELLFSAESRGRTDTPLRGAGF